MGKLDRWLSPPRILHRHPGERFDAMPAAYWSEFAEAARLRNTLAHPKADPPTVGESAVKREP
jgi:hypothetical protein